MSKMAQFMERVSKLSNPPKYYLTFNVKDLGNCKKEVLAEAYKEAKEKAEAIAVAAGKNLKECIKTDFRPFEESVVSYSNINSSDIYYDETERMSKSRVGASVEDTI